jgi:hypothetical protein
MGQAGLDAAAPGAAVKAIDDGITFGVAGPVRELKGAVERLDSKLDRLGENVTALKSTGVVAVAVLLVVLVGISSPDVWRDGLYGQLLMQVLPGAN